MSRLLTGNISDKVTSLCVALRVGDCADDVKQAIANKIIFLAKTGERSPDVLCEQVLKDIGRQPDM